MASFPGADTIKTMCSHKNNLWEENYFRLFLNSYDCVVIYYYVLISLDIVYLAPMCIQVLYNIIHHPILTRLYKHFVWIGKFICNKESFLRRKSNKVSSNFKYRRF